MTTREGDRRLPASESAAEGTSEGGGRPSHGAVSHNEASSGVGCARTRQVVALRLRRARELGTLPRNSQARVAR
eukprot:4339509-Prymnesium_polylepis.1